MGLVYKQNNDEFGAGGYVEQLSDGSTTKSFYRSPGADGVGGFNLQYPNNLDSSPEYGKNRVVFFINVVSNSAINRDSDTSGVDFRKSTTDLPPNQFGKLAAENIKELVYSVGKSLGQDISVAGPKKRLLAAISLYVPNALSTSYSTMWGEDDLSTGAFADELLGASQNVLSAMKGDGPGVWSTLKDAGSVVGAKGVREMISGMSYIQKATQMTPGNAKAEQLFNGVDFRTFSFDYQFAPKTKEEAKTALQIIRMFRHHMLPEFADKSTFLYIYPSEFDIKYYRGNKENPHIEKQMTAVLTNMVVNYTPNGQFNTFGKGKNSKDVDSEDMDGMPAHINLSLTFKELGLLSKETSPYDGSGL